MQLIESGVLIKHVANLNTDIAYALSGASNEHMFEQRAICLGQRSPSATNSDLESLGITFYFSFFQIFVSLFFSQFFLCKSLSRLSELHEESDAVLDARGEFQRTICVAVFNRGKSKGVLGQRVTDEGDKQRFIQPEKNETIQFEVRGNKSKENIRIRTVEAAAETNRLKI